MKVVIFAGGLGTRLAEETDVRPKPMVEIGGRPILWHIMKTYSHYGYNDFIICLGYRGIYIKEYFLNYYMHNSDMTIELRNNNIDIHYTQTESFNVTLVDTGTDTKTAGRLKRIQQYIKDEPFMLTYGDGVCDVNIGKLVDFHNQHGKIATVTAIQPAPRFGEMELKENGAVQIFKEKPAGDRRWINGGFFVLSPEVFSYLDNNADDIMWEDDPLETLSNKGQLMAYRHYGFWKCMDAMRDKIELEELWQTNNAKWKIW